MHRWARRPQSDYPVADLRTTGRSGARELPRHRHRHRRHLHRPGVPAPRRADADRQDREHAQEPGRSGDAGGPIHGGELEDRAGGGWPLPARHHRGDQRRARAQRGPAWPAHHRRLQGRAGDRAADAPGALRHHPQAADAGLPGAGEVPQGDSRTHRLQGGGGDAAGRGSGALGGARTRRGGCSGDRRLLPVLVPESCA